MFGLLLYYTPVFDKEDSLWPHVLLVLGSFVIILIIFFGLCCVMLRMRPKDDVDILHMIHIEYLLTMPEYLLEKIRERDIIDECIDIETDLEY